jgi:hypothetical protein
MKRISVALLALLMTASLAYARGGGNQGGGGNPGNDGPGGGHLIVAADGTVLVTRTVTDSATDTHTTTLTAITPSGNQAWSVTLTDRGRIVLSGSNILSVSEGATAGTSVIGARSLSTGAASWSVNVTGRVMDLQPFSGGTYAIVVVPPATEGAAPTRTLLAISNSGATIFSKTL